MQHVNEKQDSENGSPILENPRRDCNLLLSRDWDLMKEVFFIRHGLTKENELELVIGSSDPPLSEKGKAELYSLKEYVVKPDIVFSSDLKRASETATILFPRSNVTYLPQLRERYLGAFEGKPIEDWRKSGLAQTGDEEILTKNGIESPSSLIARAELVLRLIIQAQPQKIVMVSHGAFINFLVKTLLPEHRKVERLANAHYHKIVLDHTDNIIGSELNKSWLD